MNTIRDSEEIENFRLSVKSLERVWELLEKIYRDFIPIDFQNKFDQGDSYFGASLYEKGDRKYKKNILNKGKNVSQGIFSLVIDYTINNFFKNGLKNKERDLYDNQEGITVSLCDLTSKTLKKIENGEIEDAIGFEVIIHLEPRFQKDGDKGFYTFRFEVKRKKEKDGYFFSTATIKKSEVKTILRDESITRSREAYRTALMRVVRSGSFSKK